MEALKEMTITIPPEFILIKKDDLVDLQNQIDQRVWVGLNSLEDLTGVKTYKLADIFKKYREEVDVFKDGFVKFPDGGKWSFNKEETLKWLKVNHARIWKEEMEK